jgi:hypothetical protein
MDLTAGLDDMENRKFSTLQGLELRPFGLRPVAIPTALSRLQVIFYSIQEIFNFKYPQSSVGTGKNILTVTLHTYP